MMLDKYMSAIKANDDGAISNLITLIDQDIVRIGDLQPQGDGIFKVDIQGFAVFFGLLATPPDRDSLIPLPSVDVVIESIMDGDMPVFDPEGYNMDSDKVDELADAIADKLGLI